MYNVEELEQGINFSIVELNGAEPTHIYDPKHSLFFCMERTRASHYVHV
jgi:hypothetical protein